MSVCGSLTRTPSTMIEPACTGSSPLMQRRRVLLPEPERPIIAMISPASIASEMFSRTVISPNRFVTFEISTSDMEFPFEYAAPLAQREAQQKIEERHGHV